MRVSTFWRFSEWEEVEDVKESMTAMARANPATFNLVDLISVPLVFTFAVPLLYRKPSASRAKLRCPR